MNNSMQQFLLKPMQVMHQGIERFWIHPLEVKLIPRLESHKGTLFRRIALRLGAWFANLGRLIVLNLRVKVVRWVGSDWSVTYIGDGASIEYLSTILFPEKPRVEELPRVYFWQTPTLVQNFSGEGDLVICELNKILRWSPKRSNIFFVTPPWIKQVLEDIDRPLEDILASMNRSTRRHIHRLEKQEFTYSFTQSMEDFDFFYHRMYLPTIKSRHKGQGMIVNDYEAVQKDFLTGGLGLIMDNQKPICGGLFRLDGDTFTAQLGGVLDGEVDLVKRRVNVALFWFELNWARAQGAKRYDFGSSRAQTSNGAFEFKRQMGTCVYPHKFVYTRWNFYAQELPEKLREHLNKLGFITRRDGKFYRIILDGSTKNSRSNDIQEKCGLASRCGLDGLMLLSDQGEMRVIS
jgi:hypothetical protein